MRDRHVLVELKKSTEFLTVFLHRNVELFDSFQGQLLVLDQNFDGSLHEVFSHFDNFRRHGSREKTNLNVSRKSFKNLTNDIHKTSAQHLVSLIKDNHLQEVSFEGFSVDKIFYPSWSAHDDLNSTVSERLAVLSKISTTDQATGLDFEELAKAEDVLVVLERELAGGGNDDGLALRRVVVDPLEDADREGGSFTGP